jgi:hypothetical protein
VGAVQEDSVPTVPDVFIIESLDPDDEGNGRFEGISISHVLRLHGKRPEYRYVRTRKQLVEAINEFRLSHYRYLHISAHGDRDGMVTTNLDDIANAKLARLLTPALKGKRLFLSACSMVHKKMAAEIIPATGCLSVVGPRRDVGFTEAAVVWPAVYHLLFSSDSERVTRAALKRVLSKVASLFSVEIGYYSISTGERGFSRDILKASGGS